MLSAAMEMLARDGLQGVSIRAVAMALGLAPNALYHYFESRQHLEVALASRVAAMLHEVLAKACQGKRADAAIRAMVKSYLSFARDHHLLYEAIVVPRPASGDDAVAPELLWHFVVQQVSRVSGPTRSHEAAVSIWALVHGMAALQTANAFNEEMPFQSTLVFAVDAWLAASHDAAAKGHDALDKNRPTKRISSKRNKR